MLQPAGQEARAVALVWWWMLGVAVAVFVAVVALWLLGMRSKAPVRDVDGDRAGRRWMIGGGIVLPMTAIAALMVFGFPAGRHRMPLPAPGAQPIVVEVIAHRWWWELHYPATGVRLRDELRLPVGRPVDVRTRGADVIHSFWVPRLGGKLDAVPGRTLTMRLRADEPGVFRAQCAEFCGSGHAHMVLTVHAMEPAAFDDWMRSAQSGGGAR